MVFFDSSKVGFSIHDNLIRFGCYFVILMGIFVVVNFGPSACDFAGIRNTVWIIVKLLLVTTDQSFTSIWQSRSLFADSRRCLFLAVDRAFRTKFGIWSSTLSVHRLATLPDSLLSFLCLALYQKLGKIENGEITDWNWFWDVGTFYIFWETAMELLESSSQEVDIVKSLFEENFSRHNSLFLLRVVNHDQFFILVFLKSKLAKISKTLTYVFVHHRQESISVQKWFWEIHSYQRSIFILKILLFLTFFDPVIFEFVLISQIQDEEISIWSNLEIAGFHSLGSLDGYSSLIRDACKLRSVIVIHASWESTIISTQVVDALSVTIDFQKLDDPSFADSIEWLWFSLSN